MQHSQVTAPSSSSHGHGLKGVSLARLDGSRLRIGIVRAQWNESIIGSLVLGIQRALAEANVSPANIHIVQVPGSFELPFAAQRMIDHGKAVGAPLDAVIAVGCLIKGETMHFEYIADAACQGLMRVGLDSKVPVVLGVLTCLTEEQAVNRSSGTTNHGYDWGKTAVQMATLLRAKL